MAKIGIYSDVHISRNSSILPTYIDDDIYTTRLRMCKKSIEWAYVEFSRRDVKAVINCGDTFNSHTIASDELSTYVDIINRILTPFPYHWRPQYDITIPGNHDKFNNHFNSINVLKLTGYSSLVEGFTYFSIDDYDCYCIEFYDYKEFGNKILEMLEKYPRNCSKSILFMHGDINGSLLSGNKRIENYIATEFLSSNFDIVINGHIHCHEQIYKQNNKKIYNIGSLTSHSFADSNNHIPACYVFDTETGELEQIVNPHAILFKSYIINSSDDIANMINDFDSISNNLIVKIKCSIDKKETIEDIIHEHSNVLKYKFIFTYNSELTVIDKGSNELESNTTSDIKDDFINFLSKRTDLKANLEDYIQILNGDTQ